MKKVKNALDKSALWCYNRHIISSKAMTKTDEEPSSQRVGEGAIPIKANRNLITSELIVPKRNRVGLSVFATSVHRSCRTLKGQFKLQFEWYREYVYTRLKANA